ncbi:MAG: hypothetical protein ABIV47_17940 [Roseiflexaceae bacterium]
MSSASFYAGPDSWAGIWICVILRASPLPKIIATMPMSRCSTWITQHADLEIDHQALPRRFAAGMGNHLHRRIDAGHMAGCANALPGDQRQRSGAAPYIQHLLANLQLCQVGGYLPQRLPFATCREVAHPQQQVIAPARCDNQPTRLRRRCRARLPVPRADKVC